MQYKPVDNLLDYDGQITIWSSNASINQCTNNPFPQSVCFYTKGDAIQNYSGIGPANQNSAAWNFLVTNISRLEELQIDMRFIYFYGDYNLGPRDTAGACVNYNILQTQDISDDC